VTIIAVVGVALAECGSASTSTPSPAPVYSRVIEELKPAACHVAEQYPTGSKLITDS
jgi:hypothetical protein